METEPDAHVKSVLPSADTIKRLMLTLGVGGVGGLTFFLLGLPAAWLSGPAVSVGVAIFSGLRLGLPNAVRHGSYIFLGTAMGSAMTPETLALISRWPATLAGLAGCVLSIMVACSFYLQRVHGCDRTTARLASVPGALPYILALAEESKGDPRRVAIIQIFRLAVLLIFLPSAINLLGAPPGTGHRAAMHAVHLEEIAILFVAGLIGAYVFLRLKAPAPTLFGPLVAGAILYATGTLTSGIPTWLMAPAFLIIGCTAGANFVGIDRTAIADSLLASLGSLAVGLAVAVVWAVVLAKLVGLPVAQLWLAYAPGGVDVMTIMALALGHDAAFIGAHHIARFIGLGFFIPVWLRR